LKVFKVIFHEIKMHVLAGQEIERQNAEMLD
jgi:hypothetical protein